MRADSTRDLYAKTMAVLGLGALAGVGALVDGWPGSVDTPRVMPAAVFTVAVAARPPLMAAALTSEPTPTVAVVPVSDASEIVHRPVALSAYEPAPLAASDGQIASRQADLVIPASFLEPLPALDVRAAGALPWSGVTELALADLPAAPAPPRKVGSESGIKSAFRKTGSTIVTAGKKTGAKAVGAARAVGGAFRKALPL